MQSSAALTSLQSTCTVCICVLLTCTSLALVVGIALLGVGGSVIGNKTEREQQMSDFNAAADAYADGKNLPPIAPSALTVFSAADENTNVLVPLDKQSHRQYLSRYVVSVYLSAPTNANIPTAFPAKTTTRHKRCEPA